MKKNLQAAVGTSPFGRPSTTKPLDHQKLLVPETAELSDYAGYVSERERVVNAPVGHAVIARSSWNQSARPTESDILGTIYSPKTGIAHIYQLIVAPLGTPRGIANSRVVNAPLGATLYGLYDSAHANAGMLNIYPNEYETGPWSYAAWPVTVEPWTYQRYTVYEFVSVPKDTPFFDAELAKAVGLAVGHWLRWKELPERINDGKRVFDDAF
tara:strand:+ start:11006 stop:11641 length:636 start_codon:yes stop_codon:yes gene_type:complete